MKDKLKKTLSVALVSSSVLLGSAAPILAQEQATDPAPQEELTAPAKQELGGTKLALGDSLSDSQVEEMLSLFGVSSINKRDVMRVSGVEINQYLHDGSNRDTQVYSSALIEEREEGYGVVVEVLTPDTINAVSAETYRNAAITSGAKDVVIKIGSLIPVTGEGALTGVYSIYDFYGAGLNEENIQVAQEELALADQVASDSKLTEQDVNIILTNIKLEVNQVLGDKEDGGEDKDSLTAEDVESIINKALDDFKEAQAESDEEEKEVKLSDESLQSIQTFIENYSKLDLEEISEQLQQSTNPAMTFRQAIDFINSIDSSLVRVADEEGYNEDHWVEGVESDKVTVLQYKEGGLFYAFSQQGDLVYITMSEDEPSMNEDGEVIEADDLRRVVGVNKDSRLIVLVKDYTLFSDLDKEKLKKEDALQYLGKLIYPGESDLSVKDVQEDEDDGGEKLFNIQVNVDEVTTEDYNISEDGWTHLLTNIELSKPKEEATDDGGDDVGLVDGQSFSKEKAVALRGMMDQVGESKGQVYEDFTPEAPGQMYGPLFPNDVMKKLTIGDQPVSAEWSMNGVSDSDVTVVGAYSNLPTQTANGVADFYLFSVIDGQPVVLHSKQNQGMPDGRYHFAPTNDASLQKAFEELLKQ